MNLHGIVKSAINSVNPFIAAQLRKSTGYTTDASGGQTPVYAAAVDMQIQKQALSQADLRHTDNLNLQGALCKFWIDGDWRGVMRKGQTGGDFIDIASTSEVWLIATVMEVWPDWCSVIGVLQLESPAP